jgi:hypothetical protein
MQTIKADAFFQISITDLSNGSSQQGQRFGTVTGFRQTCGALG